MSKVNLKAELKWAMMDLEMAVKRLDEAQGTKDMIYFKKELEIQQGYVDGIVEQLMELAVKNI